MKERSRLLAAILAIFVGPLLLEAGGVPASTLPTGTTIDTRLVTPLSTKDSRSGDNFMAEVEEPIFAGGQQVIPAGSMLHGHVTFVKPPGRVHGRAEMRLVAESIVTKSGHEYAFTAQLTNGGSSSVKVKGKEGEMQGPGKSTKGAAKESGIGAAAGAGAGALAAGGTGALYGAGIGALAGLIHTLAKHHKNAVLPSGTELVFVLTSPAKRTKVTSSTAPSTPFVCANCQ